MSLKPGSRSPVPGWREVSVSPSRKTANPSRPPGSALCAGRHLRRPNDASPRVCTPSAKPSMFGAAGVGEVSHVKRWAPSGVAGYLLVRGGVHHLAYARAVENLTDASLMKLFPAPRIPAEKIPECRPHIERGDHLRLYRFSPSDYFELAAVFHGPHPETGEELV
jgi:hypothetical protein